MLQRIQYMLATLAWEAAVSGRAVRTAPARAAALPAAALTTAACTVTQLGGNPALIAALGATSAVLCAAASVSVAASAAPAVESKLRRRWYAAAVVAGVPQHCRPLP